MKSTRTPNTTDAAPISGSSLPRPRHRTLARRLLLAVTALLVPLVVVTLVGVAMFRSSIGALETFRRETVDETAQVNEASELMALADDVGEQYVEQGDAAAGEEFRSISRQLDLSLDGLSNLSSEQEMAVVAQVRAQWAKVLTELDEAAAIPPDDYTDAALDPFHDDLDDGLSMLAGLNTLHGVAVADEIASMRRSEQLQLVVGLATLLVGVAIGEPRSSDGRGGRSRLGSNCSKAQPSGSARTTCPIGSTWGVTTSSVASVTPSTPWLSSSRGRGTICSARPSTIR